MDFYVLTVSELCVFFMGTIYQDTWIYLFHKFTETMLHQLVKALSYIKVW